jgi:predicted dienelactone hydrolase
MDAELMRAVLGPLSGSPEDTFRARADIVNAKVADISFVVDWLEELAAQPAGSDRLAGRLDLARLGCFGHSMGGDAALEHCRLDARSRAAANLDGANWSEVGRVGVEGPVLLLLADHSELQMPCQDGRPSTSVRDPRMGAHRRHYACQFPGRALPLFRR